MFDFINASKLWKSRDDDDSEQKIKNFIIPQNNDGAKETFVDPSSAFIQLDFNNNIEINNTKQLIREYRRIAKVPEVDDAIQNIVDQAIVTDQSDQSAYLDLNSTEFSSAIKNKLNTEFDKVKNILNYKNKSRTYFYNWYVDSRLYIQKIYDKSRKNLLKVEFIEPTDIQFIREIKTSKTNTGETLIDSKDEYYIYYQNFGTDVGSNYVQSSTKIKIPKEDIIYVPSGKIDRNSTGHNSVIGYLDRAIKPVNNLKLLEDSLVVYRLARAPERRVFYIDTGRLNSKKSSQYVKSIINSTKNRVVYDSSTGKIKNSNANMSMLEDYYLPRREGSKGTEISSLQGGNTLGQIDDIEYFNRKIYKILHIPSSRAREESGGGQIDFGQGSTITRDELNFEKFVIRLLNQYSIMLYELLKEYSVYIDKIITKEEWDKNFDSINIKFPRDSAFEEQLRLDKLNSRVEILNEVDQYLGKFFSKKYIYTNVMNFSDEEIENIETEIGKEQLIIPMDATPSVVYAVTDDYKSLLDKTYKEAEKQMMDANDDDETPTDNKPNPFVKKENSNNE